MFRIKSFNTDKLLQIVNEIEEFFSKKANFYEKFSVFKQIFLFSRTS